MLSPKPHNLRPFISGKNPAALGPPLPNSSRLDESPLDDTAGREEERESLRFVAAVQICH